MKSKGDPAVVKGTSVAPARPKNSVRNAGTLRDHAIDGDTACSILGEIANRVKRSKVENGKRDVRSKPGIHAVNLDLRNQVEDILGIDRGIVRASNPYPKLHIQSNPRKGTERYSLNDCHRSAADARRGRTLTGL